MKKRFIRAVSAAAVTIAAMAAFHPAVGSAEIRFGTVPRLSTPELQAMYSPLAEYLSKEIGEKVSIVVPKDFQAFKDAAVAGQMDIAFANPLLYVQIKDKANIEPLALSSEVKSGTRLRGIIIVRKDSGIEKIQDLKGKKFVFMEKDSPAGYLFQLLLLNKAGFDTKKDMTVLPFAKRHDKVAAAVFDKTADAGGIREDELEKVKDKVDISQLRIVGYTDYFPNWPFFASHKMKPEMVTKIRSALLKLKPNDPQNEAILKPARLTGFIPVSDKEYDDLRKAARISDAM
jgi:phosphonate transport system substrate-binding protein